MQTNNQLACICQSHSHLTVIHWSSSCGYPIIITCLSKLSTIIQQKSKHNDCRLQKCQNNPYLQTSKYLRVENISIPWCILDISTLIIRQRLYFHKISLLLFSEHWKLLSKKPHTCELSSSHIKKITPLLKRSRIKVQKSREN